MKAVVYSKYGPPEVLQLREIDKPKPKHNEILVKIYAATVTSGDARLRSSDFPPMFWLPARIIFGLFRPKKTILGHELAGVIEAVGKDVTTFKVGDEVFGTSTMLKTGSYAEYICLPEQWKSGVVAKKPENLSFEEAAAIPVGGMAALFLLEKGGISKGKKVLIYGASGSVGSFAVQIAKHYNAEVVGVCSTANIKMVRDLGCDKVIDYTKEDFATHPNKFDLIFDAVGKTSKSKARKVLKAGGAFVSVKMLTAERIEGLLKLKEMAESGDLKPYIDRYYNLEELVEAHRYVDTGRKRGNLVVKVVV